MRVQLERCSLWGCSSKICVQVFIANGAKLSNKSRLPVEIQRTYYTQTADRYDSMHACEGATDQEVLRLVQGSIRMLQIGSLLDVGTATGLGMRPLKEAIPELFVCGVEP